MNAQQATPTVGSRKRPLLEVTNFAIDCHFMEDAESAANPEELKTRINSDHFYGLCFLWDKSRPALQRPDFVRDATYKREYWERIYDMIPKLSVALDIVRDILWFHRVHYDPNRGKFSAPANSALLPAQFGPEFHILHAIFDIPDFEPFRYANCIISDVMKPIWTPSSPVAVENGDSDRKVDGGELAYSIRFKVIPEAAVPQGSRSIDLRQYAKRAAAA